jgi:serine/threonine protein kinase
MNRDTFLQHLRRSGLLDEEELAEAAQLSSSPRAKSVARALVGAGLLTPFQARRLLAGKPGRLILGQYRILDLLGRGAMGRVFKALHTAMERVVAIKVILPGILTDHSAVDLFYREVRAAARLSHPNIVTAFDADEVKGLRILVMEYVEGPSLQALVKTRGALPIDLVCELMSQVAGALQYAHEKGMVHRDIKPANLLIDGLTLPPGPEGLAGAPSGLGGNPVVKVVDFGLACVRGTGGAGGVDTIRVEPGAVFGTVDYISPEQAHNVHAVDIRSDLYSLGCVFYYALTGQVPFPGGNSVEKLLKQLMDDPQPLRKLRPEIPPAVAAIVDRLVAKEREQRFQTPAELAAELATLSGSRGWQSAPAPAAPVALQAADLATVSSPRSRPPTPAATAAPVPEAARVTAPEVARATAPATDVDEHTSRQADDARDTSYLVPASALLTPPLDTAFKEKFLQWTAIVERTLRERGTQQRINRQAFAALQRDLVGNCEAQARASEGPRREFFLNLANLLKPWLTPEALAQTDLEIHYQLLDLFQRAEGELAKWVASTETARQGEPKEASRRTWTAMLRKVFGR